MIQPMHTVYPVKFVLMGVVFTIIMEVEITASGEVGINVQRVHRE